MPPVLFFCLLPCFLDRWCYLARLGTLSQHRHRSHSGRGWFSGMCCSTSRCQWQLPLPPLCIVTIKNVSTLCLLSSGVGWMPLIENCWSKTVTLRPGMAKPLVPLGITEGAWILEQLGATVMDSLPLDFSTKERETSLQFKSLLFSVSITCTLNFN